METKAIPGIFFALTLGSGLLWMGCDSDSGAGPDTSAHAGLISACGLLTQAEVETIFGKAVVVIKEDTTKYITNCSYEAASAPTELPTELSVTAFTSSGIEASQHSGITVARYYTDLKARIADKDSVPGVGTEAFWQKKVGKLSLYQGDVYVDIIFRPRGTLIDTSAQARQGATAAGVKVSEKL